MAVTILHPGALAGMADTALLEPDCGNDADPANDEDTAIADAPCASAFAPACAAEPGSSSYSCAPPRSPIELARLDAHWRAVEQHRASPWLIAHLFGGDEKLYLRRCEVDKVRFHPPPHRHGLEETLGEGAPAFIERFGANLYVELYERDRATMRRAICPHFEELHRLYGFPEHIVEALEELGTFDDNMIYAIPWHALKTREEVGQYAAIARGHTYGTMGVVLGVVPLIHSQEDFRRAIDDAQHIVNIFNWWIPAFEESSPIRLDLLKTHACRGDPKFEALVTRMGLAALDERLSTYKGTKKAIMLRLLANFPQDRLDLLHEAEAFVDKIEMRDPLFFDIVLPYLVDIAYSPEELKHLCSVGLQVREVICNNEKDREGLPSAYGSMVDEFLSEPTPKHWEDIVAAWRDFYDVDIALSWQVDPEADREELVSLMLARPSLFYELDERWRNDRNMTLLAIRLFTENALHVGSDLWHAPGFWQEAVGVNHMLRSLSALYKDPPPDPDEQKHHEDIVRAAKELGILFPHRFPGEALDEIVRNRQRVDEADPRPPVLVFYPRQDKNDAFTKNQLWRWCALGYRVLFFEIGSEEDIQFVHSELKRMQGGGEKQFKAMIIAGHSNPVKTAFGDADPRYGSKEDGGTFEAFEPNAGIARALAALDVFLAEGSDVIVEGCGAGTGRGKIMNVLNRLATFYRRSRLHGPTRSATTPAYRFDAHRKVQGPAASANALASVDYGEGIETYVIEPPGT